MIKPQLYVIGLGTGRCATKSLATFLNDCPGNNVSHEFRRRYKEKMNYRLNWYFRKTEAEERIQWLKRIPGLIVGDIASYYLNYVEYFIEHLIPVKFIYLWRPKEEVIKSFLRVTKCLDSPDRNHWFSYNHPDFLSGKYKKVAWDRCFPKYRKAINKKHAILKYCNVYEQRMKKYMEQYPNFILKVNTYEFNNKNTQIKIFNFLDLPVNRRKFQIVEENKSYE